MRVQCPDCGHSFDPQALSKKVSSEPVAQPAGLEFQETSRGLRFSYRWFNPAAYFLIIFLTFWDGFLVVWYGGLIARFMTTGHLEIIPFLFPVLHLAAGVGLTYYLLCLFFNRTTLEVDRDQLRVRVGPLKASGALEVDRHDLRQFFVVQQVRHTKNGRQVTYDLNVVTRTGEWKKVLSGLTQSAWGRFIERKLEDYLGIVNEAVDDEYQGGS